MGINKIKLPDNTYHDIRDSRISGVDTVVTKNSGNVVTSGAVASELEKVLDKTPTFGGFMIAPGPLTYENNQYVMKDDWNHDSFTEYYGKENGSTYFSYIEMGKLFDNANFSGGDIENRLDPFHGWRLPTADEWNKILYHREGATYDGHVGVRFALLQVTQVTHAENSSPIGLLLFPDGWKISGGAITNFNDKNVTTISNSFLDYLIAQGCAFLPASGWCDSGTFDDGGYLGCYWSSNETNYLFFDSDLIPHIEEDAVASEYYPVRLIKEFKSLEKRIDTTEKKVSEINSNKPFRVVVNRSLPRHGKAGMAYFFSAGFFRVKCKVYDGQFETTDRYAVFVRDGEDYECIGIRPWSGPYIRVVGDLGISEADAIKNYLGACIVKITHDYDIPHGESESGMKQAIEDIVKNCIEVHHATLACFETMSPFLKVIKGRVVNTEDVRFSIKNGTAGASKNTYNSKYQAIGYKKRPKSCRGKLRRVRAMTNTKNPHIIMRQNNLSRIRIRPESIYEVDGDRVRSFKVFSFRRGHKSRPVWVYHTKYKTQDGFAMSSGGGWYMGIKE